LFACFHIAVSVGWLHRPRAKDSVMSTQRLLFILRMDSERKSQGGSCFSRFNMTVFLSLASVCCIDRCIGGLAAIPFHPLLHTLLKPSPVQNQRGRYQITAGRLSGSSIGALGHPSWVMGCAFPQSTGSMFSAYSRFLDEIWIPCAP
jgi:hypothetical protein